MRFPASCVVCLLPLMLTACIHNTEQIASQPLAPPIVDTPPPAPAPAPANLPPPVITVPAQPAPADTSTASEPQPPPKPPAKHRKPANKSPEMASNGTPGANAIGQLSSGNPSDLRQQIVDSITATERGLNGISRALSDQEQKTAAQIREFLKEAKTALASGDLDGANTLAAKAKVLLGELLQ
jgi:hypothetical protein